MPHPSFLLMPCCLFYNSLYSYFFFARVLYSRASHCIFVLCVWLFSTSSFDGFSPSTLRLPSFFTVFNLFFLSLFLLFFTSAIFSLRIFVLHSTLLLIVYFIVSCPISEICLKNRLKSFYLQFIKNLCNRIEQNRNKYARSRKI